MNILFVKLGSIGDIVHTLPALAAVRRRYASARIDWLVESRSREILLGNPLIDDLLEVDTLAWRRKLLHPATWRAALARAARWSMQGPTELSLSRDNGELTPIWLS